MNDRLGSHVTRVYKDWEFPSSVRYPNQATTLLLHYAVHAYNGAYLLTGYEPRSAFTKLSDPDWYRIIAELHADPFLGKEPGCLPNIAWLFA